jgi:hypothetical protein
MLKAYGTLEIYGPGKTNISMLQNIRKIMYPLLEAPYRRFDREAARPGRRGMMMILLRLQLFLSRHVHNSILSLYPEPRPLASLFSTIPKGKQLWETNLLTRPSPVLLSPM